MKAGRFPPVLLATLPKQKVDGPYGSGPGCWKAPKYPELSARGCGARER